MEKNFLTELSRLIARTQALSEAQKGAYLEMAKHLPEEKQKKLYEILKKEEEEGVRIESVKKEATSKINKEYIKKSSELVKKSEKKFIAEEEKVEKAGSEKILDELNNT